MQPTLAPAPPMRSVQHAVDTTAEQRLREQLMASVQRHGLPEPYVPHPSEQPMTPVIKRNGQDQNIDPAIAGSAGMTDLSGDDASPDSRSRGKRELSTSKRAAQNRAAQRAFRQRKEGHIKSLENQVREYNALNESFKAVQAENYSLRDYILSLQSHLLQAGSQFPPAPAVIDLRTLHRGDSGENSEHDPTTGAAPTSSTNTNALSNDDQNTTRNHPHDSSSSTRIPTANMRQYIDDGLQVSAAQAQAAVSHDENSNTNEEVANSSSRPPKRIRLASAKDNSADDNTNIDTSLLPNLGAGS